MKTIDELVKESLKNPEFKAAYEKESAKLERNVQLMNKAEKSNSKFALEYLASIQTGKVDDIDKDYNEVNEAFLQNYALALHEYPLSYIMNM